MIKRWVTISNPAEIALGPIVIGTVFNVLLHGIMIAQMYSYFNQRRLSRGLSWIKYVVGLLFAAETMNTALMLAYMYTTLILRFGSSEVLRTSTWEFNLFPATAGVIASTVQLFYGWRVQVLIKKRWLTSLIYFFALIGGLSSIVTSVYCNLIPEFAKWSRFAPVVELWVSCAIVADTIITFSLIWFLYSKRTGAASTDHLVNRLITSVLQTGTLTCAIAILDIATGSANTSSGLHFVFNIPLPKLYTNSLLAMLNSGISDTSSAVPDDTTGGQEFTTVYLTHSIPIANDLPVASIPEDQMSKLCYV